jgi:hypothetical protein
MLNRMGAVKSAFAQAFLKLDFRRRRRAAGKNLSRPKQAQEDGGQRAECENIKEPKHALSGQPQQTGARWLPQILLWLLGAAVLKVR